MKRLALPVVLIALALRLWDLQRVGICHWDAGTYTAGALGIGPYAKAKLLLFYAPPMMPALHRLLFALFGISDTLVIGFSALVGALCVAAVWRLGRDLVGDGAALIGAAALAGMEYHIIFSRQPLADGLFTLLFCLAAWALYRGAARGGLAPLAHGPEQVPAADAAGGTARGAARDDTSPDRVAWGAAIAGGLATGAALLTKYHGFFPLVLTGGFLLLRRRPLRAWRGLLLAAAIAGLAAAWLALHIRAETGLDAFRANRAQWLREPALYLIPQTLQFIGQALHEWVALPVLLAAAVGFGLMLRRRSDGDVFLLLWVALFLSTLPLYALYPRLLLPLLVPLVLAAGVGLQAVAALLMRRRETGTRTVALLAGLLLACGAVASGASFAQPSRGYAEAGAWLAAQGPDPQGRPDLLLAQHSLLFYVRDAGNPFLTYDEPEGLPALRSGRFRYLVADLRSDVAPEFAAALAHLQRVATIDNPLPEPFVVNLEGFRGLDELRSPDTLPARREELSTIRIFAQPGS